MNGRWLIFGALGFSCGGLAMAACSSDDKVQSQDTAMSDAATDSTTTEVDSASMMDSSKGGGGRDGGDGAVATVDAGTDGSTCSGFDASGLDDASVAAGFAQVWQVYRCYGCHQSASQVVGDAGMGIVLSGNNAGLGDSGTIFPPNLTSDPATGIGCWTDSQVTNALLNGVDDEGRTLCKPMPKFSAPAFTADGGVKPGYPMDAGTAKEIVDYLRSLPVVVNQVTDTTCPAPDGGTADASDQ